MSDNPTFYELLREGVFTQLLLVGGSTILIGLMIATGKEIPDLLQTTYGLIVGYYFGNRNTSQVTKVVDRMLKSNGQSEY